jgi:RNA polymerase sigma-70 factor (ECF subfamily)
MPDARSDSSREPSLFPTTCWGRLRPGSAAGVAEERAAFADLARWYAGPIRKWICVALGGTRDSADDLAQDFFAWALESGFLRKADPARGRFRAFLKTALRNYAADQHRRFAAARRGGGRADRPLGPPHADSSGGDILDPSAPRPDEALDEAWRRTVISLALDGVRADLEAQGRPSSFEIFRQYYLDQADDVDYDALAARHGISRVDVSNELMRAKRLYRTRLQRVLRETVEGPVDMDEEIRWLLGGRL